MCLPPGLGPGKRRLRVGPERRVEGIDRPRPQRDPPARVPLLDHQAHWPAARWEGLRRHAGQLESHPALGIGRGLYGRLRPKYEAHRRLRQWVDARALAQALALDLGGKRTPALPRSQVVEDGDAQAGETDPPHDKPGVAHRLHALLLLLGDLGCVHEHEDADGEGRAARQAVLRGVPERALPRVATGDHLLPLHPLLAEILAPAAALERDDEGRPIHPRLGVQRGRALDGPS